jgi:hypothetical protein
MRSPMTGLGRTGEGDYEYDDPDEYRVHPHDNEIPYDWARKDG